MFVKIVSRHGRLEKSGNKDYILSFIDRVTDRIDLSKLGIIRIVFKDCHGSRGNYTGGNGVNLDPYAKSFSASYRGYKYKTFGGVADLTPGGVLAHELGHAFHKRVGRSLTTAFKAIRKAKRRSITSYGTGSVGEDIAESFRLYVTNPDKLRQIDAKRYNVIHKYCTKYLADVCEGCGKALSPLEKGLGVCEECMPDADDIDDFEATMRQQFPPEE